MNRRNAIQTIILASAGTLFMTSCADANVLELMKDGKLVLDRQHTTYLSKISETILPVSSVAEGMSPASDFILRMLNEVHKSDDVQKFATGFEQYKLLMKESQVKIKKAEPTKLIELMTTTLEQNPPQEELIFFINKTKDLSIWNLKSSKFYQTKYLENSLIPPPYEACVEA